MPVTQDRLVRLREFGLSEYAARCYLALLDLGIAEARDVSSLSKVPQAKIYHVLEQLHQKGLVVILPEFPKKYAPVPFEEYLGRLYDEHSKAAETIDRQRDDLARMFRVRGDTDIADRGFFTVIRGRRNVLAKIEEMIASAQREIVLLGTNGTALRSSHMLAALRGAKQRDVRVRVLAPIVPETVPGLAEVARLAAVRGRELGAEDQSAKVALLVCDSARAFLIHFVPDDANVSNGKDIGVLTDQEAMVAAIQAIVEPHWTRATPYERRRADLEAGRDPEFIRIYTSREEIAAALDAIIAHGGADAVSIAAEADPTEEDLLDRLARAGARSRAMRDLAVKASAERAALRAPAVEVRHLRSPGAAQGLVIDGREAFFRLTSREDGAARPLVVHTNAAAVVETLRAQAEALWELSVPAEQRARELGIFPELQPGDIGIGRLFQVLRDAVVVADPQNRIVLWNAAATTIFASENGTLLGRPLSDLVAPESRRPFEDRVGRFRDRSDPAGTSDFIELDGVRADGGSFRMEAALSLLKATTGSRYLVLFARDITPRQLSMEAARSADQRVRRAFERIREAFYALDRDWRFVYRNPVVRAMQNGKSDAEIDGQVIWEAIPDLAGTKFETELRRAAAEGRPVTFEEHYPRMGMTFEVTAYPDDDGLSVYFRDVTARVQAQATAANASAQLEALLHGSLTAFANADARGRITAANEAFAALVGRPASMLVGADHADLVEPAQRKPFEQALATLGAGSARSIEVDAQYAGGARVQLALIPIGPPEAREIIIRATRAA